MVAFGAAGVTAGFSILQTCLLSILLFSGASQFAVVGIMGAGGAAVSAIATATLLGFRNALYGLQMAPILKVKGLKRILAAQITIDESTAVATLQENDADRRRGFYITGVGVYIFWNLFTFLGALGASAIGDPSVWGLDAAVPAAFCGLIWPRLKNKTHFVVSAVAIAALVGVQTFANKKELVIDQRFAGVLVSLIALKFKAPFPVVVISAAITSAAIYNWF